MNKSSHLIVTKEILLQYPQLTKKQRMLVMIGCILPDILVHTYVKGHTWSERSSQVFQMIRKYRRKGMRHDFRFLQYGCVLHYIEDFFTWPHNTAYEGTLKEHVNYELRLNHYLMSRKGEPKKNRDMQRKSTEQVIAQLQKMHEEYMNAVPELMTDQFYIKKAAGMIAESLLAAEQQKASAEMYFQLSGAEWTLLEGIRLQR